MTKTAPKRRTTTVTEELDEGEEEGQTLPAWSESPLFAANDRRLKLIDHVAVHRKDPDSGYLGQMPVDLSEATLFARWGGGLYRLEAKNAVGQILPGAVRSVKLAGDPIFSSEIEERRWRKVNGLTEARSAEASGTLSAKDLLLVIEAKDEKRRAEQLDREDRLRAELEEREERERRARDERAAADQRAADERRAREQKEHEEREDRRRKEAREDDERRARLHREDMERLTAQNAQTLAQSQQFFTQLATTLKSDTAAAAKAPASGGGELVKALLTGLQIAREMKGDAPAAAEPPDLLTTLVARLPETLQEMRQTGSAMYQEITGKKKNATPATPAAPAGRRRRASAGPDQLTIQGATATKAKRVLLALQKAGKDPERELDRMLTFAAQAVGVDPNPPPAAPAQPEHGPEETAPAVRTTQRRARAVVRTKHAARAAAPAAARRAKPRPRR